MYTSSYDVIIIGGSYAGLSAAMALGRSLRKTLVIDSGKPCNRQTPASHNFITHDGEKPAAIAAAAKAQVMEYDTVEFMDGLATAAKRVDKGFEVVREDGKTLYARKLVFATGMSDLMPAIPGFAESWGITVIHCPYCHGYEVRGETTGILANGDMGFEYSKMIRHWTKDLTLFTNGPATFSAEQLEKFRQHDIAVVETEIDHIAQDKGKIEYLQLKDGFRYKLKALYHKARLQQHCPIPEALGCELTEHGYIKVDGMQKTTVDGVYACGDNTTMMRAVASAVAGGNLAGAMVNRELIEEDF